MEGILWWLSDELNTTAFFAWALKRDLFTIKVAHYFNNEVGVSLFCVFVISWDGGTTCFTSMVDHARWITTLSLVWIRALPKLARTSLVPIAKCLWSTILIWQSWWRVLFFLESTGAHVTHFPAKRYSMWLCTVGARPHDSFGCFTALPFAEMRSMFCHPSKR